MQHAYILLHLTQHLLKNTHLAFVFAASWFSLSTLSLSFLLPIQKSSTTAEGSAGMVTGIQQLCAKLPR